MTRIDAVTPEQKEELKKEIKAELKHDAFRKRMFGCGACAVIVLIVIGTPLMFVASSLAKTGFVEVPVLSGWLYRSSAPSRTVIPLAGSGSEDILRVMGARAKFDPSTGLAALKLSETELTTLAQQGVASAPPETLPFPIRTVQFVVDPTFVEVYAVAPREKRDATIRIRFLPRAKDGRLDVDVREILLGNQRVPDWAGDMLFATFGQPLLDASFDELNAVGRLFDVKLEQGDVTFLVNPAVR